MNTPQLSPESRTQSARQGAKVAVTGASGMVGTALAAVLKTRQQTLIPLVRKARGGGASEVVWDPSVGKIDAQRLEGLDAVVHLAGENIASGRWNAARKQRIRDSRVVGTRLLCDTLASLRAKPRVLVSASATGFYGDRHDAILGEDAGPGQGFLSDVCREWEDATKAAEQAGIRVVRLRIGVVLSPQGGALQKMLTPFRLGVGGRIGSGGQYWSWISLDDLVGAIVHCLDHDELSGAVNAVSPEPLTNREFTAVLAHALHRPAFLPMPAFAARLALGEMADALLLASTRVVPLKLRESGYRFRHATLAEALKALLG